MLTNKVLELVISEITTSDMQESIKSKIMNPLLFMIYCELAPYIYILTTIVLLMFIILVLLLVFFVIYLKKRL